MAAILFLKSLCNNSLLSSLVQFSYNLHPSTLDAVTNRIMLEDSGRESHDSKTTYLTHMSKPHAQGTPKSRQPAVPTQPPRSVAPTRKLPSKSNPELQTRVTQLAEELKKLQSQLSLNAIEEDAESTTEEIADSVSVDTSNPEVSGFHVYKKASIALQTRPNLTPNSSTTQGHLVLLSATVLFSKILSL